MFGLKQLRRRQLFNFTLTELILLILFILLLFFWFKYAQLENERDDLEDEGIICEENLFKCKQKSKELDRCSKQVEGLTKDLREAKIYISKLEAKITELQNQLNKSDQKLINENNQLMKENLILKTENKKLIEENIKLKEEIESLKKGLNQSEQEKINEINKLKDEIKKLKEKNKGVSEDLEACEDKVREMTRRGVGLPACWPQNWIEGMPIEEYKDNKWEPIFTIRLTEKGIIVEKDFPSKTFGKQFELLSTNQIIFNTALSSSDFRISMRRLLDQSNQVTNVLDKNITLRKECRHRVRVFDETNDENKKLYKQLLSIVEDYFYIYEWKEESYSEYVIDPLWGYNDRQKSLGN